MYIFNVWYAFQKKQRLFPSTALTGSLCVSCEVGTGYINIQATFELHRFRFMWRITFHLSPKLTLHLCLILNEQVYLIGWREAEPPSLPCKLIVRRNVRLNLPRQVLLMIAAKHNIGLELPKMYSSKERVVKRQKDLNRPYCSLN